MNITVYDFFGKQLKTSEINAETQGIGYCGLLVDKNDSLHTFINVWWKNLPPNFLFNDLFPPDPYGELRRGILYKN